MEEPGFTRLRHGLTGHTHTYIQTYNMHTSVYIWNEDKTEILFVLEM